MSNDIKMKNLECKFEDYILKGDYYYNNNIPGSTVLFLHGGGLKTTRKRYEKLRIDLLNNNIFSYAFDFIGHGDNNEDLYNTSLHSKVLQAKTFIDEFIKVPFSIVGASMGGYISIKLLEMYDIKSLILFVPAIYSDKAYDINFGNDFSEILRKEGSWKESNTFSILKKYKNKVLLISVNNDLVIPLELTNELRKSLEDNINFKDYIIKNDTHSVFDYLYEREEYKNILSEIIKMIYDRI